jgi:hypothetical protein
MRGPRSRILKAFKSGMRIDLTQIANRLGTKCPIALLSCECRPNYNSCAKNNFDVAVNVSEVVDYPKKHCARNQQNTFMES